MVNEPVRIARACRHTMRFNYTGTPEHLAELTRKLSESKCAMCAMRDKMIRAGRAGGLATARKRGGRV